MNKNTFFIVSLVLAFVSCKQKNSEKEKRSFEIVTNEKTEQLSSLYQELFEKQKFNGNVLVADNGKIIFQKSYGLSNEKDSINLNLETKFELASVSKQFTAMGIVQLQKEGKLSYDDKISKFIPELQHYENITIKNLLNHTGGLPDYIELAEEKLDKTKIATNEDIIKLFQDSKPKKNFEPNEKWEYSNTGYLLLATIIKRASGKEFGEYLKETIFDPLNMKKTFVYRRRFNPKKIKNYAQGYIYSDSLKAKILPDNMGKDFYVVYLDGVVGDGTVSSNIYDLLKWDRALYKNDFINEKDKKLIFSSYQTKDSTETDYGFGWMIDNSNKYKKIALHSGGWGGYITYIERHLDNDKTIIILQNNSTRNTEIPVKNTRRILYDIPIEKLTKLNREILESYAGTYLINESNKERKIIFENDKLWVPMNPQVKLELIPVSKTKFIVDGFSPEVSYTFILNSNNDVEKYRVQQEGKGLDRIATRKK